MKKYAPHLAILAGLLVLLTWQGLRAGIIQAIIPQAVPTGYFVGGQAKFATTDSNGTLALPGGLSTGQGAGKTGYIEPQGATSGGQGFTVADVAGTATLYVLPTAPGGSGTVLTDNGSTSCPTLPSGAPSNCEGLKWGAGGGGGGTPGSTYFTYVSATGTGPNDTASETSLIGAATTGSKTIPANTLLAGALTEFHLSGQITTPAVPDNLTLNMYMGATKVGTSTITGTNIASLTTQSFAVKAALFTLTGGASCAFVIEDFSFIGGTSVSGDLVSFQGTGTTFDCTTTEAFDFKAKWAGAQVGESILGQGVALYTPGAPVTSVFGATGAVNIPVTTTDISTPANPSAGNTKWYTKAGTLCSLNPSGTENCTGSGGGGGSFVLVEQHTASASAELDFTTCISSTYDTYELRFVNLAISANGKIGMQLSTNGGVSYDTTSGHYTWQAYAIPLTGAGGGNNGSGSDSAMYVENEQIGSGLLNGRAGFYGPSNTAPYFLWEGNFVDQGTSNYYGWVAGGRYTQTGTAINAFRIIPSTGNIASGTARCYGIAK